MRCKINPVKKNPYEGCQLNCTFPRAATLRLIFYMQKTYTAAQLTGPEESSATVTVLKTEIGHET